MVLCLSQENHTVGHPCRLGVLVDGEFSCVSDASWQRSLDYAHDTLVAEVRLEHPYTKEPLSVSPLTWSHAALVLTVHEHLHQQKSDPPGSLGFAWGEAGGQMAEPGSARLREPPSGIPTRCRGWRARVWAISEAGQGVVTAAEKIAP